MKLLNLILNFFVIFLSISEIGGRRRYHNTNYRIRYNFAIIADQDKLATVPGENKWRSFFYPGHLMLNKYARNSMFSTDHILVGEVVMDKKLGPQPVESNHNLGGRGMELSELLRWNGKLYSMDDKTGTVFELVRDGTTYKPKPWVTLENVPKSSKRKFKCEWATIKDGKMYVGSTGANFDANKYVNRISSDGTVEALDWRKNYQEMATTAGYPEPGYIIHEAAQWSPRLKRWIFIPRKGSITAFNGDDNEPAANIIIIADETFQDIEVTRIQGGDAELGVSSFKIIPGLDDRRFVALKTMENGDKFETYITAFDINGRRLYPDQLVEKKKYEGFEFINEDDKRR